MTVGEYLSSLVIGLEIPDVVYTRAAYSPREVGLTELDLEDDAYPEDATEDFQARLDYAASTVYYAVLGVFSGGGYSEQVGDVRISKNGTTVTASDRARFKSLADSLRNKHGFETESATDAGGMYDISYTRYRR